jgi:hypothetical protein
MYLIQVDALNFAIICTNGFVKVYSATCCGLILIKMCKVGARTIVVSHLPSVLT